FFGLTSPNAHLFCQPEREDCSNRPFVGAMAVMRSTDAGETWSMPRIIARSRSSGPGQQTQARIRTGIRLPETAIDRRTGQLYVVWQDNRFSHGRYDGIAISTSADGGRH